METTFGADDAGEEVGINVVPGAGLGDEFGHVGGCGQGQRGGWGQRGVWEGFDVGDGLAGEIDEVLSLSSGGLGGKEEADVGVVEGLVAGAVVGEAVT